MLANQQLLYKLQLKTFTIISIYSSQCSWGRGVANLFFLAYARNGFGGFKAQTSFSIKSPQKTHRRKVQYSTTVDWKTDSQQPDQCKNLGEQTDMIVSQRPIDDWTDGRTDRHYSCANAKRCKPNLSFLLCFKIEEKIEANLQDE